MSRLDEARALGLKPTFAGFLKAIYNKDEHALEKVYGTGYSTDKVASSVTKTAMQEGTGSLGGYLVPAEYSTRILDVVAEESFVYPRATVIPMGTSETRLPTVNTATVQSSGTPPFFGGMLFKWGFEQHTAGTNPPETEPTFQQIVLNAWDLIGYSVVTNQMMRDLPPDGEDRLLKIFARAAAWQAEYAFFQGLGAASTMPLGLIPAPATLGVTRTGANHIATADISGMAAKLLPFSWKNSIWATHPTTLSDIMKLTTYWANVPDGQHESGAAGYLMTRPLFVTDKVPALGGTGDLMLFDPSLYLIGNRQEVLIDFSDQNLFRTNQGVFRVWLRMDAKPWLSNFITLSDASSTVSAYVKLNA